MRVLWLAPVAPLEITEKFSLPRSASGGWVSSLLQIIKAENNIELCYLFPADIDIDTMCSNDIRYISFVDSKTTQNKFELILHKYQPDIIHIFGTEMPWSMNMVDAAKNENMIDHLLVSIQGLVSVIARHYNAFLPMSVVYAKSFRDVIKRSGVYADRKLFFKRGISEEYVIKSVKHIAGRTDWDHACATRLNSGIRYYKLNEVLRCPFYSRKWSVETCEKHTIFVSSGSYPLKGLHLAIEVLSEVIKVYPDTVMYIAGRNQCQEGLLHKIKRSAYENYNMSLIKRYGLSSHIRFTGVLNETEMCERYLHSHVFLCPSTIENSSNSVCEAMLLGMPVVASYVGGISSLLTNQIEGYIYQADAPYMAAYYIMKVFDDDKVEVMGNRARQRALERHATDKIRNELLEAYRTII